MVYMSRGTLLVGGVEPGSEVQRVRIPALEGWKGPILAQFWPRRAQFGPIWAILAHFGPILAHFRDKAHST